MDTKIIDGAALAKKHQKLLQQKVKKLPKRANIVTILVGEDPASVFFTNLKQKKAEELGIYFTPAKFPKDTDPEMVAEYIKGLNDMKDCDGIMIQLPLPWGEEKTTKLIDIIDPKKDVDGLTGKGIVLTATVRGILSILDSISVSYENQIFAVVGSEGAVGREVVKALKEKDADIIEVDKKKLGTSLDDIKNADIVISCTGDKNSITVLHIGSGTVLIDVGLGDFDPECYKKASKYTPPKGGVGPMTIISLMENAVELATKKG